jgi:LacI family transcriptional regulator
MAVSIEDVAQLAQVSISTVSRVINNRTDLVNEKTRARVESAIKQLGYQPNAFARGLMLRRSEIVGLILPDLHGEFYSEIIRGANLQARTMGYNLMLSSLSDGDSGDSLLSAVQQRTLMDGVAVMVSELTDRIQEVLAQFKLPFVILDDDIEGVPHDSVVIDQRHGSRELTRHLVTRCGATRIVFVAGPPKNFDSNARLEACREVLTQHGIAIRDSDLYFLDYEYETAFELAADEVKRWAAPGSCVFAANDEMAAGVLAAAAARGVNVPRELAVVGFDDTRIAKMTRPLLTTVRVPMSRMGAQAIQLLCERVADPNRPVSRLSLEPELIVRESCGAARA